MIVGNVSDFTRNELNKKIRKGWSKYITDRNIKAFPQEVISPTVRKLFSLSSLLCSLLSSVLSPLFSSVLSVLSVLCSLSSVLCSLFSLVPPLNYILTSFYPPFLLLFLLLLLLLLLLSTGTSWLSISHARFWFRWFAL